MGNFLCDCNRSSNPPQKRHVKTNSFDAAIETEIKTKTTYPTSRIIKSQPSFTKETTLTEFWSNLEQSSIINKGQGNPEDKYEFIEIIGKGSFGTVHKVKNKKTGEQRAIKIIPKQTKGILMEKKIITEIELLEQIDHPNIIKLYEFYDLEDKICIVSELGNGGPLSKYKGSPKMTSELEIAIIMFQLLSAVNYCHNKNLMHRDIKPDNILVENKQQQGHFHIKLIDFGTAKMYLNSEQTQVIGSAHFIAPEVLLGNYTHKCDLWSCGIVLYYLLTTKYPFDAKNKNDIYTKIKKCNYDRLEGNQYKKISPEAKDLVHKLIKSDFNERLSAQKALEHIWFKKLKVKEKLYDLGVNQMKELLNNIFTFNMEKTLQIPVINYLVHNNLEGSSYVNYASILFSKIDINNDGSLNKNEFIQNMNMIFSEFDTEIDKEFLMEVFDKIDVDKSNKIGYREFVCAAVDRKELLKDNMLKEAFEFFDKDKNGSISLEEIKKAFSKTQGYNHNDFNEILKQIDLNNDAVIDFAEFKSMMKAILD